MGNPKLPYYLPQWPGIRFSDLCRAIDKVYDRERPAALLDILLALYGKYETITVQASGWLGVSCQLLLPKTAGPVVALLAGTETWQQVAAMVVNGFWDTFNDGPIFRAFDEAANETERAVRILVKDVPGDGLLIAGHSLGGAVATVVGERLASNYFSDNFLVATFGSPRIYKQRIVANKGGGWLWRFANVNDVVTALPSIATTALVELANGQTVVLFGQHPEFYAQTSAGIVLSENDVQFFRGETYAEQAEFDAQIRAIKSPTGRAATEHLLATYARRLDQNSLELVSQQQLNEPGLIAPFDLTEVGVLHRVVGIEVPPTVIRLGTYQPLIPHPDQINVARALAARESAARRDGPSGWALSVPKLNPTRSNVDRALSIGGLMVSIPKSAYWSYAKVGDQHWAAWMSRTIVQCKTKAAAKLYCRRANQALRRLQVQNACDIDAYPAAWIDYLALATTPGNGFSPLLVVAS